MYLIITTEAGSDQFIECDVYRNLAALERETDNLNGLFDNWRVWEIDARGNRTYRADLSSDLEIDNTL